MPEHEDRPWRHMSYEEAKERIPDRALPDFWVGDVAGLDERFASLKRGEAKEIATSPGGRPLHLVAYGAHEPAAGSANYNSAIGARMPSAYMDKAARTKPVVFLVGPVHGHEVEALTGLVNLIHVMETGQDLRGADQAELRELGDQCRLLIVPTGNPDGVARFEPRALQGMGADDIRFWGQGTWSDGWLCGWPQVKRLHPMRGDAVGFLGCYFDDAGVNPMHDEFFRPMSVSAPAILDVARAEGPDLIASLHSSTPPPWLIRPAYATVEAQERVSALAELFYALLEERDLPHGAVPEPGQESGETAKPFNLASALYHVSGAVTTTLECPHGIRKEPFRLFELDELLEIQLTLYRAALRFALDRKRAGA